MIVKQWEAARLLAQAESLQKARAALFYGPNGGLARALARRAAATVTGSAFDDPLRFTALDGAAVAEDTALLAEEVLCPSLALEEEQERAVLVSGAGDVLTGVCRSMLASDAMSAFLVLAADSLQRGSTLRRLFEGDKRAWCVPCYEETGRALSDVIGATLSDAGKEATPQAIAWLEARHAGADRALLLHELDKLVCYTESPRIEEDDVAACLTLPHEASLEEAAYRAAEGEAGGALAALDELRLFGVPAATILRVCGGHFLRLLEAQGYRRQGEGLREAVARLRPPPFFRKVPRFVEQLNLWSEEALLGALDSLLATESAVKSAQGAGDFAFTLCRRRLVALAYGAERAKRKARAQQEAAF